MEIGKEILRIRKANNLSARRMSELIGVESERLRKWESQGYNPRDEDAVKIQRFFGVTLDELPNIRKIEIDLTSKKLPSISNKNSLPCSEVVEILKQQINILQSTITFQQRQIERCEGEKQLPLKKAK